MLPRNATSATPHPRCSSTVRTLFCVLLLVKVERRDEHQLGLPGSMASDNPNASTFGAAMSRNPLGNSKFGTRSRPHCLLSEVSDAPWLLSGESENAANAASSFESHGILCSPSLVNPKLIASVRAEAETALDAALSNPIHESAELCGLLRQPCCRYNIKLDLTPSIAACVRALRASRLAPVVALTLGREDAALVGLSCIVTKPGAKAQLASCETPASEQYARTAHQAALAQEGTRMVSIRLALCDIEYPMGALTVWPATHTPAFHEQAFGSESGNNGGSGGAAMALRETPSVHMDLRAGDALLVDSRLWHADGANTTGGSSSSGLPNHAGPPRSQIVLIATFASPRLFPPPSECTMLPRLIGRFSLLNLEAALTSGDWVHEWPLVEGSKKTEDRRISLPEQSVVQLLDVARARCLQRSSVRQNVLTRCRRRFERRKKRPWPPLRPLMVLWRSPTLMRRQHRLVIITPRGACSLRCGPLHIDA